MVIILYMFLLPISYTFCSTSSSYMRPWLVFFHTKIPLGVHRFLAEALALNLTADCLCFTSLHVPSACFLHILLYLQLVHEALACFFSHKNSARCAPIPRPEALALNLTADYLCLSSLHVPSACFLHICSTSSSYMRPWLVFFTKQIPLGVHRFLAEALALNLTADYLCLSSLHVPSACFLHICSIPSART